MLNGTTPEIQNTKWGPKFRNFFSDCLEGKNKKKLACSSWPKHAKNIQNLFFVKARDITNSWKWRTNIFCISNLDFKRKIPRPYDLGGKPSQEQWKNQALSLTFHFQFFRQKLRPLKSLLDSIYYQGLKSSSLRPVFSTNTV